MGQLPEATHLGKVSKYPQQYDKTVLVRVDRYDNRKDYNIDSDNLPFIGYDTWHGYEASCMTSKGLPVVGMLKIVYPSSSKYIVESKSLKLYLNSFNMTVMGNTIDEAVVKATQTIEQDLSDYLQTRVRAYWHRGTQSSDHVFRNYVNITYQTDIESIEFKHYNESPNILTGNKEDRQYSKKIYCELLRSNCKVTSQPDWGTLFIYYNGLYDIQVDSLVKYIVSFRNENHFHEEVVEMVYKRLYDRFEPHDLLVGAIYTRRGGIDICPQRATSSDLLDMNLMTPDIQTIKLYRQ
jgi:7-cyano-7-deazaguanine reductase